MIRSRTAGSREPAERTLWRTWEEKDAVARAARMSRVDWGRGEDMVCLSEVR